MMKLFRSLWFFGLLVFLLPVPASAVDVIDDSKATQYLFTLSGMSGALTGDELTLNEVPLAVYFADRPVRKAGHVSLAQFVEMWDSGDNNFDADPPSAELSIFEQSGDTHAVVILEKPQVTGNSIAFKVKVIGGDIPKSFGHATIFIDSLGVKKSPS